MSDSSLDRDTSKPAAPAPDSVEQDLLNPDPLADLASQTARIPWTELQRFFAAGKVIHVGAELNLVQVGIALKEDSVAQFQEWTQKEWVQPITDDQAATFVESNAIVWALAVAPWVLVQAQSQK